jgi:hypothetical protein
MKKIKLVQSEQEILSKVTELNRKSSLLKMEANKEMSNFWLVLNSRTGGGDYIYNNIENCIYERSFEETLENNKNNKQ